MREEEEEGGEEEGERWPIWERERMTPTCGAKKLAPRIQSALERERSSDLARTLEGAAEERDCALPKQNWAVAKREG